jgi:HEAT repeat protein
MRVRTGLILAVCLAACSGCGKGQKTTAELLADLKGGEPRDKLIAVRLLPQRKDDAAQVIPPLINALKDKDDDIRISAAIGLGGFGEQARDAVPPLRAALKDRDARVREAAGRAIARIDPSAAPKGSPKRSC